MCGVGRTFCASLLTKILKRITALSRLAKIHEGVADGF
jgi:hypothetical protein